MAVQSVVRHVANWGDKTSNDSSSKPLYGTQHWCLWNGWFHCVPQVKKLNFSVLWKFFCFAHAAAPIHAKLTCAPRLAGTVTKPFGHSRQHCPEGEEGILQSSLWELSRNRWEKGKFRFLLVVGWLQHHLESVLPFSGMQTNMNCNIDIISGWQNISIYIWTAVLVLYLVH